MPNNRYSDENHLGIRNTEDEDQVTEIWIRVGKTWPIQIIRNYQFQDTRTRIYQDEPPAKYIRCQPESSKEEATMAKDKTLDIKPESPEDKAQELKIKKSKKVVVHSL